MNPVRIELVLVVLMLSIGCTPNRVDVRPGVDGSVRVEQPGGVVTFKAAAPDSAEPRTTNELAVQQRKTVDENAAVIDRQREQIATNNLTLSVQHKLLAESTSEAQALQPDLDARRTEFQRLEQATRRAKQDLADAANQAARLREDVAALTARDTAIKLTIDQRNNDDKKLGQVLIAKRTEHSSLDAMIEKGKQEQEMLRTA